MLSDEEFTLFDLIGRDWTDDKTQSVLSHYDGLKAINLDTCGIYDFRGSGVKIFTDKTGGGNEISEVYIYDAERRVDRPLAKMPCDLQIGQTQAQVRALLGEPYDAHLGHTYPPPRRSHGVICALPHHEDGWDRYHSSQLAERLKIRSLKPFLLTIEYPLRGDYLHIRDAEERILLIVPECQRLRKVILKRWYGDLPQRAGISSVEGILERDRRLRSIFEAWQL